MSTFAVAAEESAPPYGHPDFYPSPQRPLGWRGDGSGAWPGAGVVTSWDAKTRENVVWRSPMPGPSFSQPVVIGEKVFTMADPNLLVCVNAHDGKVLWQIAIDHTTLMPPEKRKKARAEQKFILELRRNYGRWRIRYAALEKKLKARNLSFKKLAILDKVSGEKKTGGLDLDLDLEEEDDVADDAIVGPSGPIDQKLTDEYRAILRERKENCYNASFTGYNPGIDFKQKSPLIRRLVKANRDYDLYVTDHWGEAWTTWTFATPCTDGSSLYVATMNNAVARVDLDGKIIWMTWDRVVDRDEGSSGWHKGAGTGTRFVASPAYYQGKLVVNQNGEVRVYDAATGKKLWSIFDPHKKRGGQFPWRSYPEGVSPVCTEFTLPDGSRMPVFTDGHAYFRLEDGAIMKGRLRFQGAPTPMLAGGLVVWKAHPPPKPVTRGVQRVTVVSRDEVKVEDVWAMDGTARHAGGSGNTDICFDGKIYFFNDVFDLKTGKHSTLDPRLLSSKRQAVKIGHISPIIAGKHQYCIGDRGKAWVLPIEGGPVIELTAAFEDRRVYAEIEWRERWAWTGNMQHGSPCAQANRIFFRTKGYLWCFGDPKQPFPVPKNCPIAARTKDGIR